MKKHILIVDDDEMIQSVVSFLAEDTPNARTTVVGSGEEMHASLKKDKVDLVVLDLGLPDEDGLVLARQIRARGNTPIIVLTGDHSHEVLISALQIGVNDFVRKPFDPLELQLRIRNQLRDFRPESWEEPSDDLAFGGFILDTKAHSLKDKKGKSIHLTPNEYHLLETFLKRPNTALSRNELLDVIARDTEAPTDRAIDVYMAQLRQKIEKNPRKPDFIKSVRGYGYLFEVS